MAKRKARTRKRWIKHLFFLFSNIKKARKNSSLIYFSIYIGGEKGNNYEIIETNFI